MVIIYTDKEIFGFDVGSRAANIATLIALILVIIWLALSTAYCITRGSPPPRYTHHTLTNNSERSNSSGRGNNNNNKGRGSSGGPDKSRRLKFEDWGEMDSSTNSVTPMHPTSDSDSEAGSIEIGNRVLSNTIDGQVISSPYYAQYHQQQQQSLPPPPTQQYQQPIPPVLPKPPSDIKQQPTFTTAPPPPPVSSDFSQVVYNPTLFQQPPPQQPGQQQQQSGFGESFPTSPQGFTNPNETKST